eukprot:TRINITY_DN3215_c0_g3_i2.p1 TRINITY_DN3215_c0_g3~~TRINITY_DN3215_c0_g3_i2.p1  ORF type:complete len:734 (+),score=191.84 TRINITY_DN3215_c0_g3_i2:1088-3289(+)
MNEKANILLFILNLLILIVIDSKSIQAKNSKIDVIDLDIIEVDCLYPIVTLKKSYLFNFTFDSLHCINKTQVIIRYDLLSKYYSNDTNGYTFSITNFQIFEFEYLTKINIILHQGDFVLQEFSGNIFSVDVPISMNLITFDKTLPTYLDIIIKNDISILNNSFYYYCNIIGALSDHRITRSNSYDFTNLNFSMISFQPTIYIDTDYLIPLYEASGFEKILFCYFIFDSSISSTLKFETVNRELYLQSFEPGMLFENLPYDCFLVQSIDRYLNLKYDKIIGKKDEFCLFAFKKWHVDETTIFEISNFDFGFIDRLVLHSSSLIKLVIPRGVEIFYLTFLARGTNAGYFEGFDINGIDFEDSEGRIRICDLHFKLLGIFGNIEEILINGDSMIDNVNHFDYLNAETYVIKNFIGNFQVTKTSDAQEASIILKQEAVVTDVSSNYEYYTNEHFSINENGVLEIKIFYGALGQLNINLDSNQILIISAMRIVDDLQYELIHSDVVCDGIIQTKSGRFYCSGNLYTVKNNRLISGNYSEFTEYYGLLCNSIWEWNDIGFKCMGKLNLVSESREFVPSDKKSPSLQFFFKNYHFKNFIVHLSSNYGNFDVLSSNLVDFSFNLNELHFISIENFDEKLENLTVPFRTVFEGEEPQILVLSSKNYRIVRSFEKYLIPKTSFVSNFEFNMYSEGNTLLTIKHSFDNLQLLVEINTGSFIVEGQNLMNNSIFFHKRNFKEISN